MEQKEFIQVMIENGASFMVSISSIAFVQPMEHGARITMKETLEGKGAYYIDTNTGYYTIKLAIENYTKSTS